MKTHTSNFKNQIKTMGRELDSKITYTLNGVNVELGKEQLNSITPTYQGALLKSVMKELDIDSNVYIPEKTILNYQFGVKVNGEYEYINFGNYVVYKTEKQEDTNSYKLICYDKMLYSMIDYEKMDITYPISIRDYINAICNKLGLTFKNANSTFANYDKQIQNELYLDSSGNSLGYTFRDVLDELSQVTASCICINENDKLEIRYINDTNDTIDEEFLKDVNIKFGEKYGAINTIVLSRSADSDNIYYPETLPENPFEFKISDNQIMNFNDRVDYLPDIYSKLNGLEFYINDFSSTGVCYYELLDRYNVKIGDNTYSCVMLNDEINITQGLEENVYTEMPEETQTDYTKADKTDRKINQTYLIVDKQNQQIESVVNQIGDRSEKTSTITQDIDGLNSKVTDIENLTRESFGTNFLYLGNASNGQLLYLKIKGQFNLIYPSNDLFPSKQLYPVDSYLIVDKTEELSGEAKRIKLPINYLNSDDVFIYDSGKCRIERTNGTIEQLEDLDIELFEGDNYIYLESFKNNNLIFSGIYAIKSNFTDLFATKIEMDSKITQTAEEINLEVSKKVDENEVVSSINLSNEEIKINSNKISLEGYTTINENFKINTDGDMECNNAKINGTIKGSTFEGTNDESIYMKIGTNLDDQSSLKANNCLQILRPDNSDMLTIGTRYWGADGNSNLNQLVFISPAKFFTFYSPIEDSKVTANSFEADDIVSATRGRIGQLNAYESLSVGGTATIYGDLTVEGTKNRLVTTENYGKRLLNAYETTTPYFGDIGSNITDDNGYCKIQIEDIFKETIELENYKVFVQECGDGKLYVKKYEDYFEVIGTPNLEFDWEIKSIQKGYKNIRLKEKIIESESDKNE